MHVERISVPRAGTYPSKNRKAKAVKMQKNNKIVFSDFGQFCPFLPIFCHLVHF